MDRIHTENPKSSIGMKMRQKIMAEDGAKGLQKMQKHSPLVARWTVENLFGDVYGSEVLDLRTRILCTISALIVLGAEGPLANCFRSALRNGITKVEIGELIAQILWYAGLPAAVKAINILDRVLSE